MEAEPAERLWRNAEATQEGAGLTASGSLDSLDVPAPHAAAYLGGLTSDDDDRDDYGSMGDGGAAAYAHGWQWSEDEMDGAANSGEGSGGRGALHGPTNGPMEEGGGESSSGAAAADAGGREGPWSNRQRRWRQERQERQQQQHAESPRQRLLRRLGRRHSDGEQQQWPRSGPGASGAAGGSGANAGAQTPPQVRGSPTAAAAAAERRRSGSEDGTAMARPSGGARSHLLWGHAAASCGPGGPRGGSGDAFGSSRGRFGSAGGSGDSDSDGDGFDFEPPPPLERFERPADDAQDTTAAQVLRGRDPQGIPWERLQFTREQYRQQRLSTYRNYTNIIAEDEGPKVRSELAAAYQQPPKGGRDYAFLRNWRGVPTSIVHFQLRNLLHALSPHELLAVSSNAVTHWSSVTRTTTEVLNLRGLPKGPRLPGVGRVQISTLGADGDLVAAGGFTGELVVARIRGAAFSGDGCADDDRAEEEEGEEEEEEDPQEAARRRHGWRGGGFAGGMACGFGSVGPHSRLVYSGRVTQSENGITNGIEIASSCRLGRVLITSNNDNNVRVFDATTLAPRARLPFPWAVNFSALRPDSGGAPGGGAVAAVVGDDPVVALVDLISGRTVTRLAGHRDFSFAAAWHPGGQLLATGNQDGTTAVWDVRSPGGPLVALPGRLGAIRALRWSSDGRHLVAAEPADYVHVYSMAGGVAARAQEIDLFGEISGVALSPCGAMLFVGVSDPMYSSVLQFQRRRGAACVPDPDGPIWAPTAQPRARGGSDEDDPMSEGGDSESEGGEIDGDGMAAGVPEIVWRRRRLQAQLHMWRHSREWGQPLID